MQQATDISSFLAGGGECGELVRALDWSATPLGPPSTWPCSLRTVVAMMLRSRHPMFLWWGPELIQIYNDAYLPSFGVGKHPAAMGQRGADCWQEIWPIIWPQIDGVLSEQRSSWNEDHLVPIFRNNRIEEVYWTYGYSPVIDEGGSVGGVLVVCTETTPRVLAERRSRTLSLLAARTALAAENIDSLLDTVIEVIRQGPRDFPFGFLCRTRKVSQLEATRVFGLEHETRAVEAVRAHLARLPANVMTNRLFIAAETLAPGAVPAGCAGVFAARFNVDGDDDQTAVLAFGLSGQLPFNEQYRAHVEQIADQVELALARTHANAVRVVAEKERDNLLLQAPVATALLTGPDHVFQLANPLYCRMVGRTELVGKSYVEAFPELVDTPLPGFLDRVYRTGEPFVAEEQVLPLDRRGDGVIEDCYFKFNLEPLRDASGTVFGMMAVAVEITDQVKARQGLERIHQEREKLLEQAEAAARAKDEFLAMLGHELRNPLSPISTALQLMKLKGATSTLNEQRIIERQLSHLTRLVDDLLDVAKIIRGKVELSKELLDVADIVAKAVEISSDLFEQRNHRLTISVPRGQLYATADPVRLAQVVSNLLTNAARYTEKEGGIEVRAWRAGDVVMVRVSDNGTGISADLLPRIFDVFVQGKRNTDRAQGGLGIGLALVKNLVELHGGQVNASSGGPGKGSAFTVTLPAADRPTRRISSGESVPEQDGQALRQADGSRVLLVDDNADAADSLAELLRALGHVVRVTYDPIAALEVAARFQPDFAVLDLGLPVMDGYQLAARLRDSMGSIRLIALSGYGQAQDKARSDAAGFERHLVKPVDAEQLMGALSSESDGRADRQSGRDVS